FQIIPAFPFGLAKRFHPAAEHQPLHPHFGRHTEEIHFDYVIGSQYSSCALIIFISSSVLAWSLIRSFTASMSFFSRIPPSRQSSSLVLWIRLSKANASTSLPSKLS